MVLIREKRLTNLSEISYFEIRVSRRFTSNTIWQRTTFDRPRRIP